MHQSSGVSFSSRFWCMAIITTSIGRILYVMSFLILFVRESSAVFETATNAAGYSDLGG